MCPVSSFPVYRGTMYTKVGRDSMALRAGRKGKAICTQEVIRVQCFVTSLMDKTLLP